jgi:ribosome biogenesis GTPase / thiamine phosphate phosphatase
MILEDLGYSTELEKFRIDQKMDDFEIGRIMTEHKERYEVITQYGEFESEITGNLRFSAKSREDYPAVGDWVALMTYDNDFALIHKIFPRKSVIERQSVSQFGEIQIIAANIDFAFITQAVDRDFNINRIERYLTICYSAKVEPIIILNKIDLVTESELNMLLSEVESRIKNIRIIPICSITNDGYDYLKPVLVKSKTYCFLGSSGVGKSTIINNLLGQDILKTNSISKSNNKGRNTTNRRELNLLDNGSILIDNPGMREVGIADTAGGLEITFDRIIEISQNCKFSDCTHTNEKGCAIIDAIENGTIEKSSYENYLKMEREKQRFQTSIAEKRKKDKQFGKYCKEVMAYKKTIKY